MFKTLKQRGKFKKTLKHIINVHHVSTTATRFTAGVGL